MTAFILLSVLGLGAFIWAVLHKMLSDMVAEELQTRIERLAGFFARLAVRRLPPDLQDAMRPDYEGALLEAFYDKTAGVPITRFFASIRIGVSFWRGAGAIRKERKPALWQRAASRNDQPIAWWGTIESGVGPDRKVDLAYINESGQIVAYQVKNASTEIDYIKKLRGLRPTNLIATSTYVDGTIGSIRLGFPADDE